MDQSALRLHDWLGTSIAEIAELLDVPENTVSHSCTAPGCCCAPC